MLRYFLFLLIIASIFASENYKQVKVFVQENDLQRIADLGIALDHAFQSKDGGLVFFVDEIEYKELSKLNLQTEVLIDDWQKFYLERKELTIIEKNQILQKTQNKYGVKNFEFGSMGGFYTLDEVYNKIDELLQEYPSLIGSIQVIGKSAQDRDIIAFKISDNPDVDEDEPEVLYTALHHAREPEGMMQMFYFIQYLLDNYESDDEAKYLVDNRELYFVPVVNPDGYYFNEESAPDGGGMWRKNRSNNGDGTFGVDLNRNYGPMEYWDAPNGGSSTNTSSSTYRGTEPFSEIETSAIRDFLNSRNIKACLNYHTFSNLLIFPYGALETETADSNTFREFAVDMTIENNYLIGTDQQTVNYSTRGNSDDYMYDGEQGREIIFAMTPEVGGSQDGFWPEQERIIPLAEENLLPNLYYANVVGGYPTVTETKIDKEYILPGDQLTLTPVIKNKGLVKTGSFEVAVSSLNDNASIVTDNAIIIEDLEARTEIVSEAGFGVQVNESIVGFPELTFEFKILEDGMVRRIDTLNLRVGQPIVLFEDRADSLELYWSTSGAPGRWERTAKHSFSGNYSYTDSRNSYPSSSNKKLTLLNEIDLAGLENAYLNFRTRYHIEALYDGGFVEISSDGGSSWKPVGGKYSKPATEEFSNSQISNGEPIYYGASFDWLKEEIDLSDFLGSQILIRFTFYSDSYLEIDGWYLDDIKIVSYDLSTRIEDEGLKYKYSLEQNFPNPFNPSTQIKFQIAKTGLVSLKIYDVLGREVKTLMNEEKTPGNYSVEFTTNNSISSGIYFYRLESGSFSQTRKMLLIK